MICRCNVAPSSVRVQRRSLESGTPPINDPARLRLLEEADAYLDHRWFSLAWRVQESESIGSASGLRQGYTPAFQPESRFPKSSGRRKHQAYLGEESTSHLTALSTAYALTGLRDTP